MVAGLGSVPWGCHKVFTETNCFLLSNILSFLLNCFTLILLQFQQRGNTFAAYITVSILLCRFWIINLSKLHDLEYILKCVCTHHTFYVAVLAFWAK